MEQQTPVVSVSTEFLIEPKEEEIDQSTLNFPKYVLEPNQPAKNKRIKKQPKQQHIKFNEPKPAKQVPDETEYFLLMDIVEASVQGLKLNNLTEV